MLNVLLLAAPLYTILFHHASAEPADSAGDREVVDWPSLRLLDDDYDSRQVPSTPPPVPVVSCGICEAGDVGSLLCEEWG